MQARATNAGALGEGARRGEGIRVVDARRRSIELAYFMQSRPISPGWSRDPHAEIRSIRMVGRSGRPRRTSFRAPLGRFCQGCSCAGGRSSGSCSARRRCGSSVAATSAISERRPHPARPGVVVTDVKSGEDIFAYIKRVKGAFDQDLYRGILGAANKEKN